jgi:hypothetical protein
MVLGDTDHIKMVGLVHDTSTEDWAAVVFLVVVVHVALSGYGFGLCSVDRYASRAVNADCANAGTE